MNDKLTALQHKQKKNDNKHNNEHERKHGKERNYGTYVTTTKNTFATKQTQIENELKAQKKLQEARA